jgi:hypothetical protein
LAIPLIRGRAHEGTCASTGCTTDGSTFETATALVADDSTDSCATQGTQSCAHASVRTIRFTRNCRHRTRRSKKHQLEFFHSIVWFIRFGGGEFSDRDDAAMNTPSDKTRQFALLFKENEVFFPGK